MISLILASLLAYFFTFILDLLGVIDFIEDKIFSDNDNSDCED